jgi:hypothetical protein
MRSRHVVSALAVAAALAPAAALAASPGPSPIPVSGPGSAPGAKGVTATLSSDRPGAKPVVLSLVVQVPLVCGRPLGTTAVTLPAAADVPASIATGAVTVNTLPVPKVSISGSTVTFGGPPAKGIMCHSVTEGLMHVVFTRAAGIGNPDRAGTYAVSVKHGADLEHGSFTIR